MNQFDPSGFGPAPASASPAPSSTPSGTGILPDHRSPRLANRHRSISPSRIPVQAKHFVLDTNVLLHDPGCCSRFGDNHVCIPVDTLSELDRFKNEQSERGANARAVHRTLSRLFENTEKSVTEGVPTPGGGSLRLVVLDLPDGNRAPSWVGRFRRILPDQDRIDHRILACTLMLQRKLSQPVILVTKDLNMQLKARAVGIACEDYLNDKVAAADIDSYELRTVEVASNELQRFASSGSIHIEPDRARNMALNEYVLLTAGARNTMPARYHSDGSFRRLHIPKSIAIPGGIAIRPFNLGQQCLLDALLDPEISVATCFGHAGTGKTLLAITAGLSAVYSGAYRGLTVSRPVVAMGDTLGYLPGGLEEKMRPWLQPIYDALDFLMPPPGIAAATGTTGKRAAKGRANKNGDSHASARPPKPYDSLIENGVIEIEALCYIRGRSIPHRFFVLDEAQQLTPLEAKTVITRMSKHSQVVLIGDPAQIDNPYVDSRSNGLVYTRDRLRNQRISAHVSLSKGERSTLAELGATLM